MAIYLTRLEAIGPNLPPAEVVFDAKKFLIRGPSETGKSYIRDCLWYLLGGDKVPKTFPLAEGYQELRLCFACTDEELGLSEEFEVRKAHVGGLGAVFVRPLGFDDLVDFEPLEEDVGDLLVRLSGAAGKRILRSTSDKGPVTGDDLRHWSLLSQTAILSEAPTAGDGFGVVKRVASFNLFLSGNDDAAVQLRRSTAEVERIKGQLSSAEAAHSRIQAGLPHDATRVEVSAALERLDDTLTAMARQYEARAERLKMLRGEITDAAQKLGLATTQRNHSANMIARFQLLDRKYKNDLERLGATDEGVAFFDAMLATDCPLCLTPVGSQPQSEVRVGGTPRDVKLYRDAIAAEASKIRALQVGLAASLEREDSRYSEAKKEADALLSRLTLLQASEAKTLNDTRIEFSADPKTLAVARSELSAQLAIFDEMERLTAEIERLKRLKVRPRIQVNRDGGTDGRAVANLSLALLTTWGISDIRDISLDAEECDLVLNDRPRLSYGAGRRALYLTALTIALMEHALGQGHPHLGTVVIDSPLKAYADPASVENESIPLATVRERFYAWLATRTGLGQVVVLENEPISPETATGLHLLEFSGIEGIGRPGFYPLRGAVNDSTDDSVDADL